MCGVLFVDGVRSVLFVVLRCCFLGCLLFVVCCFVVVCCCYVLLLLLVDVFCVVVVVCLSVGLFV